MRQLGRRQGSLAVRILPIEEELDKNNAGEQVVADVVVIEAGLAELAPDLLKVGQEHLVGASIAAEALGTLAEELAGYKVNPVQRSRSPPLKRG